MTFHAGLSHPALSQLPALLLFALHLGVAARALTRPNRTPASRAAWVAVIMLLPLVGVVAYFLAQPPQDLRYRQPHRLLRQPELRRPRIPRGGALCALCAAPRRGVRTVLVLPTRNNSKLVGAACYSTYAPLLAVGVEIYEYPLGLLHTKSITADRQIALVGSANMDWRSLQLNFENNLVIDDAAISATIRERQLGYVSVSQRVALDTARRWPFGRRLVQNAVGMMAPVL